MIYPCYLIHKLLDIMHSFWEVGGSKWKQQRVYKTEMKVHLEGSMLATWQDSSAEHNVFLRSLCEN